MVIPIRVSRSQTEPADYSHVLHMTRLVVVTLVRRPQCVPTPFRPDNTTSLIVLNMSKTIGGVCCSVRIFPSPTSFITFPTRLLHDVQVHCRLSQDLIPFWQILWVVRGSTWQIVTVWQPLEFSKKKSIMLLLRSKQFIIFILIGSIVMQTL